MARFVAVKSHDTQFTIGSLNSLLPACSIARTLFSTLEQLDFSAFEQRYCNDDSGRPAIEPRRLAAVWILATVRGVSSSIKLTRLCKTDIEMRWLLGDAPVEKSTLCTFRKEHLEALADLSTQVLALFARAGQLPGKDFVLDGTIVEAAASCGAVKERAALKKRLDTLREKIKDKLEHAEDPAQEDVQVRALERREQRLQECLREMDEMGLLKDEDRVTVTEPEASLKRLKDAGFAPAHNVQAVSDAASGAIISLTVIEQGNDQGQLEPQVKRAIEELERVAKAAAKAAVPVEQVAADAAYHDARQLERLQQQGIAPVVPDGQVNRRPTGVEDAYLAQAFTHDPQSDTLTCPQGKLLQFYGPNKRRTSHRYRASAEACAQCPVKHLCCPNSNTGRTVNRSLYAETLGRVSTHVQTAEGQRMLRARSITAEGLFARLKHHLHWKRCQTWGRKGAQAEAYWRQITHNLLLVTSIWKPMVLAAA